MRGAVTVTANAPGLVPQLVQAPLPAVARQATIAW